MPDLGIGEFLAAAGTFLGTTLPGDVAAGLGSLGVGAGTAAALGSGIVDAGIGAGAGALEAGITGGDPGLGALTGGITGGTIGGFGGLIGDTLGIGVQGADALAGAAGGAIGSGITGGNPLTGALGGAASGFAAGSLSTPSGASASGTTSPGTSAAAIAPSGLSAPPTDLTAGLDTSAITDPSVGGTLATSGTSAGGNLIAGSPSGGGGLGTGTALGLSPSSPITDPSLGGLVGGGAGGGGSTGGSGSIGAGGAKPSAFSTAVADPSAGNILKALGANAGPLVAGAGLLENLTANNSNLTGLPELKSIAGSLENTGANLASYVQNGTLPPGAQAGLDQAKNAAAAAIRSKYASMGMSGSTAEVQDLNNLTLQTEAQQFQIADSLLKTGLDATNISAQTYGQLLSFDQKQSADTGAAIASLAAALSGGGGGTTIRLATGTGA